MGVGEYISVSSQRDTELADLKIEAEALGSTSRGRTERVGRSTCDRGSRIRRRWPDGRRAAPGPRRGRRARARRARHHRGRAGAPVPGVVDVGRVVHYGGDPAPDRSWLGAARAGLVVTAVVALIALLPGCSEPEPVVPRGSEARRASCSAAVSRWRSPHSSATWSARWSERTARTRGTASRTARRWCHEACGRTQGRRHRRPGVRHVVSRFTPLRSRGAAGGDGTRRPRAGSRDAHAGRAFTRRARRAACVPAIGRAAGGAQCS